MKKKNPPVAKKYLLQILSFFSAIVLWFAITYSEDPEINLTINNIEINTLGENNLQKNNLIFVDRDELPPISIDVRGRRSDVKSILNSISATIDLSDITEAGEYSENLTFTIPNPSVMITKNKFSSVTVKVENSITKEVPVYIRQTGADKNKDYIVKSTPAIDTIQIKGASSDIILIKEAYLSIDVSSMTSDNSDRYSIAFASAEHDIITPKNKVVSGLSAIEVSNKIYSRKTIPIVLNPDIDISGYQVIVKSFSKDKIEIGIEIGKADEITTIYADFADGITASGSNKYQMKLIIPENVYCPEQTEELMMTADIEKITTELVSFDIIAENIPSGLSATIIPSKLAVELTGAKSKMKEVKAKVDLSGLSAGIYHIPVVFITENTGVIVNHSPTVSVEIK